MDIEMDASTPSWSHTISSAFTLLFFSFAAMFSTFSLLIYVMRVKPWCRCDVCTAYLNSTWTHEFHNLCDWFTHLLRKSPSSTIHLHLLGNIITANPDNVHHILKTNFNNYPKGKPFSAILGDLLGQGIFNVDGHHWMFQRKLASLELGSVSVRMYAFDLIITEIRSRLIPLLSSSALQGNVLDLQDVFKRFSFDNICKFSFGFDPECLDASLPFSSFATAFDAASNLSAKRGLAASPMVWKMKRMFNVGSEKELKEAIKIVNKLAEEIISKRRKSGFSNNKDLLSRFMGSVTDDRYLRDIVISFLLAGRDTVASVLTSFFWLLSQHPEVESKIRAESDRVMGRTNNNSNKQELASFEQMSKMHYLNAALHESMRLFPPVQFDSKFAQEDDILPDGTLVTKGMRVTYHPYAMGRMERIWGPDCLEFKPERWLKKGVFVPENMYKYPVFQAGLRVCLGKDIAMVGMKAVVLAVVRMFNIRVSDPNQQPRFSPGLTATVRGGMPAVVQEIREASVEDTIH